MISSSSTPKQFLSGYTKLNLSPKILSITNDNYLKSNSNEKNFNQNLSSQPLKRLKTSRINSDIHILQQDNNKYLVEQFFFQTHPFSDLILIIQDKEIYVDKSVLSSVSKVFQSYFQDENINSIEIIDVSPNDMIELLQFLYPQFQCTINYQTVTILLILAHRFEIDFILNACRTFILLYLSKFNIYSNDINLIEQDDGTRLMISSIIDNLCIWFREFFYMNDNIICENLLKKFSQFNNSNFYLSKIFNDLEEKIQYKIFQIRAKYLENSRTSIVSDIN